MCCTFNALAAEEIYRWSFLSWIILLCDKNQWKASRKSQFSESVANLQKENVRDSFEAPPELPEGWDAVNSNFQFVFRFKYFLGPSFIDSIVLFLTGGVNQGMNQDLKLVSSLPECFQGFDRHCKYTMPLKGSFFKQYTIRRKDKLYFCCHCGWFNFVFDMISLINFSW